MDLERVFHGSFSDGNDVRLLWRRDDAFRAIFDAVDEARSFICLQFYIFSNDETGRILAERLKKKAAEGVGVYVLYDHLGSIWTPRSFWRELEGAGVNVRASHPFVLNSPLRYAYRDHRKLLVVDGLRAFMGGLNIANEYRGFRIRSKEPWRDTGIMIEGPVVKALAETFVLSWKRWGGNEFAHPVAEPEPRGTLPVLPIIARTGGGRRRMRRLLYYSIKNAQKEILLTTAYFTPSLRMLMALRNALKRGVRIRMLLPQESDSLLAYYAARATYATLLRNGAEIYDYTGRMMHAKTYTFDGTFSVVGSANLDFRSLRYNDEGNVGIFDVHFARQLKAIFDEDVESSVPVALEQWVKRPWTHRVLEWFCWLARRKL